MGNIGTTATIILIVILFLAGLNIIADDIGNNTNLDSNSRNLLTNLSSEYANNYNSGVFATTSSNVTTNSTFASVDAFSRQYLEDKSEIQQKTSTTDKILGFPSLFLRMFGVENESILIAWNGIVYGFLVFILGLQIYKAIRTGEVD